jgi:hypothetical protein
MAEELVILMDYDMMSCQSSKFKRMEQKGVVSQASSKGQSSKFKRMEQKGVVRQASSNGQSSKFERTEQKVQSSKLKRSVNKQVSPKDWNKTESILF